VSLKAFEKTVWKPQKSFSFRNVQNYERYFFVSLARRSTRLKAVSDPCLPLIYNLAYAKSLQKLGITHPIAAPPNLYVK
jgi:hypothetical protein